MQVTDDLVELNWQGRWDHITCFLDRAGPWAHPDFDVSPEVGMNTLLEICQVLVVGAGGLGCELLKDLALTGFRQIHVIDMDTIDVSNLNRQFLFRHKDVGRPKANVAAEFINNRIPGCKVVPHFKKIQDYDESFYRQFHVVVCGLDSIIARRWINGMLVSMLSYKDGKLDTTSIVPMIDGGTEGFKGNARVLLPGISACIECTLDLYPPQINFPMCTIATMPRLPEHCIEYVRILQWPKEEPFGEKVVLDGDDPDHVQWVHQKSLERAAQYGITGITYRLTQGCLHTVPVPPPRVCVCVCVCVCVFSCFKPLNNYMVFNDADGLYTYTYEAEQKEDCAACSQIPQDLTFPSSAKLQHVLNHLMESSALQMKCPAITATIHGRNKTLYMQVTSLSFLIDFSLSFCLVILELGLSDGQELAVADVTSPQTLLFRLCLKSGA
uniref:NEDD8-activating enzyme E1 catalytic subunit n=1 Tax=Eptatretus burgeri TaxID=7764 RepID=A0A8C4NKN0_EPTBU